MRIGRATSVDVMRVYPIHDEVHGVEHDDRWDDEPPTTPTPGHPAFRASSVGPTDALIRITSHTDRGSSDRFVQRFLALMLAGVTDELVGEIVALGAGIRGLRVGDRVVIPATVRCTRVDNVSGDSARILRVPAADRTVMKVPEELRNESDERVLFLYRRRLEWLDPG